MASHRRPLALLVAGGILALGATHAGALTIPGPAKVLEDRGQGQAVIDGHRSPQPSARQNLAALTARWGAPSRVVRVGREGCIAIWKGQGTLARLANFGGGDACSPRHGLIQTIEARSGGWHTGRGLRVGAPVAEIARAYPTARRAGAQRFLLRPQRVPCVGSCPGGASTTWSAGVTAVVQRGQIARFIVNVGAAGD